MWHEEICVQSLFCIGGLFISVGVVLIYCQIATELTIYEHRQSQYITAMQYAQILLILINIIFIILNTRFNHYYRNLRQAIPAENKLIFYIMCLPMLMLSIITLIILAINGWIDILALGSNQSVFCLAVAIELFFVVILLMDINGFKDYAENWLLNYWNCLTTMTTFINIITQVLFNIVLGQMNIISIGFENHLNFTLNKNVNNVTIFNNKLDQFIQFKKVAVVSLVLTFVPFLLMSFIRNFRNLLEYYDKINKSLKNELNVTELLDYSREEETDDSASEPLINKPSNYFLSFPSLCYSILCIIGLFVILYLDFTGSNQYHYFKVIFTRIYGISNIIVKIIASFVFINIATAWIVKEFNKNYLYYLTFINIGLCGVLIINVSLFIKHCEAIYSNGEDSQFVSNCLHIFELLLKLICCPLETFCLVISINRIPRRFKINTWCFVMYPPFIFMINHFAKVVLEFRMYLETYEFSADFQINFWFQSIYSIAKPFKIFYHWLSGLLFVNCLNEMQKSKHLS